MELCEGGELLDVILRKDHVGEAEAAGYMK
jgi:hypothetical protein